MRPFITIEKRAREALDFYEATFPSYSLESIQQHAEPHQDLVMLATFSVKGQAVMISDSFVEHEWSITPGVSFFIDAASEEELSRLASALSWAVRSTCLQGTTDSRPCLLGSKTALA